MKVFIKSILRKKGQLSIDGNSPTFTLPEGSYVSEEDVMEMACANNAGLYGFFPSQYPCTYQLVVAGVRDNLGHYPIIQEVTL